MLTAPVLLNGIRWNGIVFGVKDGESIIAVDAIRGQYVCAVLAVSSIRHPQ
jgi:hypothetical protein